MEAETTVQTTRRSRLGPSNSQKKMFCHRERPNWPLMIGMVAFIVDIPTGFTDPSTALPVQIYLWADSPERAFVERTSAAIIVLLGFLILMNGVAIVLRKRFERRW